MASSKLKLTKEIIEGAEVVIHLNNVDNLDLFLDSILLRICKCQLKANGFYGFKLKGVKTLITLNQ